MFLAATRGPVTALDLRYNLGFSWDDLTVHGQCGALPPAKAFGASMS